MRSHWVGLWWVGLLSCCFCVALCCFCVAFVLLLCCVFVGVCVFVCVCVCICFFNKCAPAPYLVDDVGASNLCCLDLAALGADDLHGGDAVVEDDPDLVAVGDGDVLDLALDLDAQVGAGAVADEDARSEAFFAVDLDDHGLFLQLGVIPFDEDLPVTFIA